MRVPFVTTSALILVLCSVSLAQTPFQEEFSGVTLPANLEDASGPAPPTFDGMTATFPGVRNTARSYVRTIDSDYAAVSFVAEITVTIADAAPNVQWPSFGMGRGIAHPGRSYRPAMASSLHVTCLPSNFAPQFQFNDIGTDLVEDVTNTLVCAGDGTHRYRFEWDAVTQLATGSIDIDYAGGAFVADCTLGPIDGSDNGFDGDTHIFFGGADGVVYDDLTVTVLPPAPFGITEIIDETGDGSGNVLTAAASVAVDGTGTVFVAGGTSDNVFEITFDGTITEIIDSTGDGGGNILDNPSRLAVDSSGNVYVSGFGSDNAFKIEPGGTITEIIDATGDGGGNVLDDPVGIAVDGSGNVFVAGFSSSNVFKIEPGGMITEIVDATGDGSNSLSFPQEVVVDGFGNVFVAGFVSGNVFEITPGGMVTQVIDFTGDGLGNTLDSPANLAADVFGNVYAASSQNNANVFKVTPGGSITRIIDSTGDGSNTLTGPIPAVDAAGVVFVGGFFSHNLFQVTPPATTLLAGPSGDGMGNPLTSTTDVAVDSFAVYVSGSASNNVFRLLLTSPFQRGDANVDGVVNIADPIFTLMYLFNEEPSNCLEAMDANDTGNITISDAFLTICYLFCIPTGPAPSAPFGVCGVDPTPDTLRCETFASCP